MVLSSVLIQGTTIPLLARWLGVDDQSMRDPEYPLEISPMLGWRGVLQEVVIKDNSPIIGKAIYEMKLPPDYLVVLIARGDEFLIPNGSIVLRAKDRMLGLAKPETHLRIAERIDQVNEEKNTIE